MALPQTILPENATLLEQACDRVFAQHVADVPVLVPSLWNANTCSLHLLGYLAWAVGVEEWDAQWPEETKRNAIRTAPLINARRGTVWAVQRVLENAGVFSELHEWFEAPTTPFSTTTPGTFDITVFVARSLTAGSNSIEVTAELLERIRRMVDAAKPLSRHYNLRAALGINTASQPILANVGTAFALLTSNGSLQPWHGHTAHNMRAAPTGTAWHYLPTHSILQ